MKSPWPCQFSLFSCPSPFTVIPESLVLIGLVIHFHLRFSRHITTVAHCLGNNSVKGPYEFNKLFLPGITCGGLQDVLLHFMINIICVNERAHIPSSFSYTVQKHLNGLFFFLILTVYVLNRFYIVSSHTTA